MTGRGDSYPFLIIPIPGWYTHLKEAPMHILRLLERRFPKHKGSITAALFVLSLSLLLLGIGLKFLQ